MHENSNIKKNPSVHLSVFVYSFYSYPPNNLFMSAHLAMCAHTHASNIEPPNKRRECTNQVTLS